MTLPRNKDVAKKQGRRQETRTSPRNKDVFHNFNTEKVRIHQEHLKGIRQLFQFQYTDTCMFIIVVLHFVTRDENTHLKYLWRRIQSKKTWENWGFKLSKTEKTPGQKKHK